ncbi:phytanoyl-CoA dioxygenase family protein [Aquihabitans sp. McL0605]|uniref:phytanoyl-CoA dioxygenase family protein n=1 Tax=Aquihabitans sp. McL0605 TaxID=3415671 RepID=UPI003CEBDA2E
MLPFLDADQVRRVRTVQERHGIAPGDPGSGLFNDTWSTDASYKAAMSSSLTEILEEPTRREFLEYVSLGWTNITKWPGSAGAVISHRDPSFVDERVHRSYGVWCAIEPVGPDTGALTLAPGSHRARPLVRVHQAEDNLAPDYDGALAERTVSIPLAAGEAIVYDHALVHGSGPNTGPHPRTVVAGLLVPVAAAPRYTIATDDGPVTVGIDRHFFLDEKLDQLDVDHVVATYPSIPAGTAPTEPGRRRWRGRARRRRT